MIDVLLWGIHDPWLLLDAQWRAVGHARSMVEAQWSTISAVYPMIDAQGSAVDVIFVKVTVHV